MTKFCDQPVLKNTLFFFTGDVSAAPPPRPLTYLPSASRRRSTTVRILSGAPRTSTRSLLFFILVVLLGEFLHFLEQAGFWLHFFFPHTSATSQTKNCGYKEAKINRMPDASSSLWILVILFVLLLVVVLFVKKKMMMPKLPEHQLVYSNSSLSQK